MVSSKSRNYRRVSPKFYFPRPLYCDWCATLLLWALYRF